MGKSERPLTWILVIVILGYLFMANYGKTECSTEVKKEIRVEIQVEDENLNIDSMVDKVIENIDIEGDVDTVIEININLTEEEETTEE
jgi:preprotein translocase subunit SecF